MYMYIYICVCKYKVMIRFGLGCFILLKVLGFGFRVWGLFLGFWASRIFRIPEKSSFYMGFQ